MNRLLLSGDIRHRSKERSSFSCPPSDNFLPFKSIRPFHCTKEKGDEKFSRKKKKNRGPQSTFGKGRKGKDDRAFLSVKEGKSRSTLAYLQPFVLSLHSSSPSFFSFVLFTFLFFFVPCQRCRPPHATALFFPLVAAAAASVRTSRAALTMFLSCGSTSSHLRVLRPQSGTTHTLDPFCPSPPAPS